MTNYIVYRDYSTPHIRTINLDSDFGNQIWDNVGLGAFSPIQAPISRIKQGLVSLKTMLHCMKKLNPTVQFPHMRS